MGGGVLGFSIKRPDSSPGWVSALERLKQGLDQAEVFAGRQLEGLQAVHAAAEEKARLRRMLRSTHLSHLVRVGRLATRENPELAQKFVFRPGTSTAVAFRTAARSLAAEAETHRELLVKHGLGEAVLEHLVRALDQFDAAIERGREGRQLHVGATAELRAVTNEIAEIVKVMDGLVRYRYMNDHEALAAWETASNVITPARTPPIGPGEGESERPAA